MKTLRTPFAIGLAGLVAMLASALCAGCDAAKPKVICVMKNPETGQKVEMLKEIWYKVPADYDQKKHIEQWKTEQRKKGFTVEAPR